MNKLSRRQSLLSQTVSEQILGAAYYEVFRYFNQITEFFDQLHKVEDISCYLESLVDSKTDE